MLNETINIFVGSKFQLYSLGKSENFEEEIWWQGIDDEILLCQLPNNLWKDRRMLHGSVTESQNAL